MPLKIPSGLRREVARFDDAVDTYLDKVRGHAVADRVFYAASELGDNSVIWLILGALRGLRSEHDWHAAVRVGVGVGVESAVVNLGIKSLVRRRRPSFEGVRPYRLRQPLTSSFPSGHASAAACVAILLSEDDRLWPLYVGVAGVVATSRVYVKIHHASDVVGGLLIGAALGAIGRRWFPLPPTEE